MERHSANKKLIGAPPGYVGSDQGNLLTDFKGIPSCVLTNYTINRMVKYIFRLWMLV